MGMTVMENSAATRPHKSSKFLHSLACWLHGAAGKSPGAYGAVVDCSCVDHHGGCIKGFVPVYVGTNEDDQERFLVKIEYLKHPLFKKLLQMSEEELGFCDNCKLAIPCDVTLFQNVLWHIESKESSKDVGNEDQLMELFNSACIPRTSSHQELNRQPD